MLRFSGAAIELLIYFYDNEGSSASKASKDLRITVNHIITTVNKLEDIGMVSKTKVGREKIISLTDNGNRVARAYRECDKTIKEVLGYEDRVPYVWSSNKRR